MGLHPIFHTIKIHQVNSKQYTLAELAEKSVPYFASNPDIDLLHATTHNGRFYRPEFESYAVHAAEKGKGEAVAIRREDSVKAAEMSVADLMAEAGLVMPSVPSSAGLAEVLKTALNIPGLLVASDLPAKKSALADAVATATHLPGFLADATEPEATEPVKAAVVRKPRAVKAATEPTTKKAPVKAAKATATKKDTSTKTK